MLTHQAKQRFIVCVARHKGTRAHATREQPMDTGPYELWVHGILILGFYFIGHLVYVDHYVLW